MRVELKKCSEEDGFDVLNMIKEIGPGENGFQNSGYNMNGADFIKFILRNMNISKGIGLEPGFVPQTTYWLFVDGRPVGYGKLRQYLNERLRVCGGHIGYCIRPSERRKGYGTLLLKELLIRAAELEIPKALITCYATNTASRRVIENNGGRLERIVESECYYWVQLDRHTGIREIHPDDFDEVMEFWSKTPGIGISEVDAAEKMRRFLLRNKGLSFCCKNSGRIVGTSLCGHDGRRGYIYHTAVVPELRGKGIGRMLVEKNLQRLKAEGIDKCHLFVFDDNWPGNAFWRETGWVKREDIFVYSKNI